MIRAPFVASSPRASLVQTLVVGAVLNGLLFVVLHDDAETRALIEFHRGATALVEQSRRESEIAVELVEEIAAFAAASERVTQPEIELFVAVADKQYPHLAYGLLAIAGAGSVTDTLIWAEPPTPFLASMLEALRQGCATTTSGSTAHRIMRTDAEDRRYAGLFVPLEQPKRGCAVLVIPSGAGAARVVARAEYTGYLVYLFVSDDPQERPWQCLVGGQRMAACPAAAPRRRALVASHAAEWRVSGTLARVPGAPLLVVVPHQARSSLDFLSPMSWFVLALGVLIALGVARLRFRGALDRAAVARSDRRYRALIDDSPISIVGWDDSGAIIDWNPAAERLLGWDRAEAVGAQVTDRLRAAASGPPLELESSATPGGSAFQERHLHRDDGSTVLVEVLVRAIEFGAGRHCSALIRDVTALRAADAERHHLERLVGAATLASGFAHDFNNLLTVIGGNLEFIETQLEPGSPVREDLTAAQSATVRAAAMVRNMLDGSRRRTSVAEVMPLDDSINRSLGAMKQVLGARIELRLALGAGTACVEVDTNWFESVLLNVLINSRHAMGGGGVVRIATRIEQRRVVIEIADSGSGMTPEVMARAFEPFFTTKPEGVGNGLGLPMVRSFARTHGGEAEIESTLGQGTTVRIRLAIAAAAPGGDSPTPMVPS